MCRSSLFYCYMAFLVLSTKGNKFYRQNLVSHIKVRVPSKPTIIKSDSEQNNVDISNRKQNQSKLFSQNFQIYGKIVRANVIHPLQQFGPLAMCKTGSVKKIKWCDSQHWVCQDRHLKDLPLLIHVIYLKKIFQLSWHCIFEYKGIWVWHTMCPK